ncbi:hypothetical protein CVT26_003684, partial [Gymnopilus dilepis]
LQIGQRSPVPFVGRVSKIIPPCPISSAQRKTTANPDKREYQNIIYYMTSRLRAIFSHRLDGKRTKDINGKIWDQYALRELRFAAEHIGFAVALGFDLHVPSFLRSLVSHVKSRTSQMPPIVPPDMRALILAQSDEVLSPFLNHASTYFGQWWDPCSASPPSVLTDEHLSAALSYHLLVLDCKEADQGQATHLSHAHDSVAYKLSIMRQICDQQSPWATCRQCSINLELFHEVSSALIELKQDIIALERANSRCTACAERLREHSKKWAILVDKMNPYLH